MSEPVDLKHIYPGKEFEAVLGCRVLPESEVLFGLGEEEGGEWDLCVLTSDLLHTVVLMDCLSTAVSVSG